MRKIAMKSLSITIALCISLVAIRAPVEADEPGKSDQKPRQSSGEKWFGKAGDPKKVVQVVYMDMSDTIQLKPAQLTIRQGETVKFVVKNTGKDLHQIAIGIKAELKEHEQLMRAYPGMVEHDDSYMAFVAPGKTEEVVWQFTKAGEFNFGCTIPGHFEAGETGKIFVVSPQSSTQ